MIRNEIANEVGNVTFNIDSAKVDNHATNFFKKAKTGQEFLKLANRKSIMTMAAPGFYMYPVVMSGGIDTSKQMEIAKAFQLTFASSVATAYSLNGTMDRSITPQVADFVKTFHQNDPKLLNANLNGVAAALGVKESYIDADDLPYISYEVQSATAMEGVLSTKDAYLIDLIAWEDTEKGLVMESLNDLYKPFDRSEHIIRQRLGDMYAAREKSAATESVKDAFDKLDGFASRVNYAANGRPNANNATQTNFTMSDSTFQYDVKKDSHGRTIYKRDKDGNLTNDPELELTKKTTKKATKPYDRMTFNKVERVQNMTGLEPTMVNVQIVAHGKEDATGSSAPSIHNVTLAVKAMPRIINSSLMIASMVEACQNSHAIFKFLKFTKGELKTFDKVLGITASKRKALQKNAKNEVKFLEQSAKRKKKGLIGRFIKNEVLPTMTVIITSFEAEKIKEICGVDLNRYEMAVKLMNKYYFLGFCIYDTEQDTLKVLFDADSDWGTTSFQSMTNATSNAKDVLSQNEVLRILGRK